MARGTASGGSGSRRGGGPRLRSTKKRKPSSTRWLRRQLSDPYVHEAKRLGYRSRAAFKLIEIDDRFQLLLPGMRIVDLGAAPGGWSQVAVQRVRPDVSGGAVVALDSSEMDPLSGATVMRIDAFAPEVSARVRAALGGPADVVLSDMAPAATGHGATDHLRIVALAEAALEVAQSVLAEGGAFVAKVWQGGSERTLLRQLKAAFAEVRHVKPEASRKESAEVYVVARGYRGAGAAAESPTGET